MRVLLQTHAPTSGLAHLGTALAIGGELRGRGHEASVAYGGSLPELVDRSNLPRLTVAEVPAEREWQPGSWYRSADELAVAVDSHLEAIAAVDPEVVIACHGVPGRIAAELAGVPVLHVFHYLHGSRHARAVSLNRDRLRDLAHPRRAYRVGRARLRRRKDGESPLLGAVAELRRRRGLPPAPPTALSGCPDTLVALSTAPFLVPARDIPAHWRYVGPISWSPPAPSPSPPAGDGPLAYVTQGSTGAPELLERSIAELSEGGFRVIATSAELLDPRQLDRHPRVVADRLLDGAECMRIADVAVIHAGQQTLLEAIRAGTPTVALPSRSDQIGHLHRIEGLGIGRGLFPPPLLPGAIRRTARRAMRASTRARCATLAARLARGWDGAVNVATLAEGLAGTPRAKRDSVA